MKTRKLIAGILIFFAVFMAAMLLNESKATVRSESIFVKLRRDRQETINWEMEDPDNPGENLEASYTVKFNHRLQRTVADTKDIWKLYRTTQTGGAVNASEEIPDLYCLSAGLGFYNEAGEPDSIDAKPVEYTTAYDMVEDYNAIKAIFADFEKTDVKIFNSDNQANFNAVMWILDNMLLADADEAEVNKYLVEHEIYTANELKADYAVYKANVLSKADIEAIQQLAMWYFTNSTDPNYHNAENNLPPMYLHIDDVDGGAALDKSGYLPYTSIFNLPTMEGVTENYGGARQTAAEKLFTYLITAAVKNTDANTVYKPVNREITVHLTSGNTAADQQPIVEVKEKEKVDVALRKFITKVTDTNGEPTEVTSRIPDYDSSKLNTGNVTTATYKHRKDTYKLSKGDKVTYTLRLYNEGSVNAYIKKVTDYLPEYLEHAPRKNEDGQDLGYWVARVIDEEGNVDERIIDTTKFCKVVNVGGKIDASNIGKPLPEVEIPAAVYDEEKGEYVLSFVDIEIDCIVSDDAPYATAITNIAQITEMAKVVDGEDEPVPVSKDRDSTPDGKFIYPEDADLPNYIGDKEANKDLDPQDPDSYFAGQEDDDDFEKVEVVEPQLDLALRKFIYAVDGDPLEGEDVREPDVDTGILDSLDDTTAEYKHLKHPVEVKKSSLVTYTIRVYNEGEVKGYVSKITDYLPKYLEYVEDDPINKKYKWEYNETTRQVETTITAKDKISLEDEDSPYKDRKNGKLLLPNDGSGELDFIDVQIVCKVSDKAIGNKILTNLAQITEETKEDGIPVEKDKDSTPNGEFELPEEKDKPDYIGDSDKNKDLDDKDPDSYFAGQEDDDDFEKVYVIPDFDLALRKFITQVENTPVNNRYPMPKLVDGQIKYEHPKTPVEVETTNTVIYTIRVYNEGEIEGYVNEITDDLPEGLEYLPENSTNIEFRWKMLDENKEPTEDVSKAKYIVTDYLSEARGKQNEIKPFDKEKGITPDNPDYRDVKVAFKVTYTPKTIEETKKLLVNVAQISKDSSGDPSKDIDSDPSKDEKYDPDGQNEDDIDFDNVRVKYFDLSLLKWVAQTKVTLNGETVTTDTGHTAETSKNEQPVKIEIKPKDLNKIVIKYVYNIQITNEGEIAGYAKEIKDYIPEGLRFEAADNTEWNWTKVSDDVITTDYLADTLLQPGDTATVPVVLTWINNSENLGEKINLAEISKDYNNSGTPDIDSTPDNKVPDEDDIDDAPVILAIKTGTAQTYLGLTAIILITIASGISLIKKYVLE